MATRCGGRARTFPTRLQCGRLPDGEPGNGGTLGSAAGPVDHNSRGEGAGSVPAPNFTSGAENRLHLPRNPLRSADSVPRSDSQQAEPKPQIMESGVNGAL